MIRTAAVDDMGQHFIAALYHEGDDVLVLYSPHQPDDVRVPAVNRLLRQWEGDRRRAPETPHLALVI